MDHDALPPPADYEGDLTRHAAVLARCSDMAARHRRTLDRVKELATSQEQAATSLQTQLTGLQSETTALQPSHSGVLTSLFRRVRSTTTNQATVTESLFARYESVEIELRRTSEYADELELCAVELQGDIEALHADVAAAERNAAAAQQRMVQLEATALKVEANPDAFPRGFGDKLTFEHRTTRTQIALFEAATSLAAGQLGPARRLRDAVLNLHEDVARYTLAASRSVQDAARQIHALGLAADAPAVLADLRDAITDLDTALHATEGFVARTQEVLRVELPRLLAQLQREAQTRGALLLGDDPDDPTGELALHRAAVAEVDEHLTDP